MHRRQSTDDDMIVTDLARMYQTATGRALQRARVEGSPHLHERKAGHNQGQGQSGAGTVGRTAMTMLGALMQEQGRGADRDDLHSGER